MAAPHRHSPFRCLASRSSSASLKELLEPPLKPNQLSPCHRPWWLVLVADGSCPIPSLSAKLLSPPCMHPPPKCFWVCFLAQVGACKAAWGSAGCDGSELAGLRGALPEPRWGGRAPWDLIPEGETHPRVKRKEPEPPRSCLQVDPETSRLQGNGSFPKWEPTSIFFSPCCGPEHGPGEGWQVPATAVVTSQAEWIQCPTCPRPGVQGCPSSLSPTEGNPCFPSSKNEKNQPQNTLPPWVDILRIVSGALKKARCY